MESQIEKLFKSLIELGVFDTKSDGVYMLNGYEVLVKSFPHPNLVIFSDYALGTMEARVFGFGVVENFEPGITLADIEKTLSAFIEHWGTIEGVNRHRNGKFYKRKLVMGLKGRVEITVQADPPRPKTLDSFLPFINKE